MKRLIQILCIVLVCAACKKETDRNYARITGALTDPITGKL